MTNEEAKDRISAIIDDFNKFYRITELPMDKNDVEALNMAIKALERSRWIPVSERLPRAEQYALITVYNQTKMCWYKNGIFVDGEQNAYTKENEELVAWMPLPEPYEAQESEE